MTRPSYPFFEAPARIRSSPRQVEKNIGTAGLEIIEVRRKGVRREIVARRMS